LAAIKNVKQKATVFTELIFTFKTLKYILIIKEFGNDVLSVNLKLWLGILFFNILETKLPHE